MSSATTCRPASRNSTVIAAPMPDAPPVTSATASRTMPHNLATRVSGKIPLVDPELAAIAAQLPRSPNTDPERIRAELRELFELSGGRPRRSWHERVDIEETTISGPDGNTIPIRIYTPKAATSPHGGLVHFH